MIATGTIISKEKEKELDILTEFLELLYGSAIFKLILEQKSVPLKPVAPDETVLDVEMDEFDRMWYSLLPSTGSVGHIATVFQMEMIHAVIDMFWAYMRVKHSLVSQGVGIREGFKVISYDEERER